MSRGGEYEFTWATTHPDNVSAIYADNPGISDEALGKLRSLVARDIPILLVCGTIDPILSRFYAPNWHLTPNLGFDPIAMLLLIHLATLFGAERAPWIPGG